jgi:hypothetical protein
MNVFKKLYGIVDNYLQLGVGSTAHGIASHTDGIEAKENNNGIRSSLITGQATIDDHCSNLLDLKQRVIYLEFSFDGTAGIVGAIIGQYGICHTTGGGYTAGEIYLATGATTGVLVPMYEMQAVCNQTAFVGTVSMSSNSFYISTSGIAPYDWALMGDGSTSLQVYETTIPSNTAVGGVTDITTLSITSGTNNVYDYNLQIWGIGGIYDNKYSGRRGVFRITRLPVGTYSLDANNGFYTGTTYGDYNAPTLVFVAGSAKLQVSNIPTDANSTAKVRLTLKPNGAFAR